MTHERVSTVSANTGGPPVISIVVIINIFCPFAEKPFHEYIS